MSDSIADREARGERISLSGLTRQEAREFNRLFVISFVIFVAIAIVAHWLVWIWRPWLQTAAPARTSMLDVLHPILTLIG